MSSKNRKNKDGIVSAEQVNHEKYYTPDWCVKAIAAQFKTDEIKHINILEPCAGDGRLLEVFMAELDKNPYMTYSAEAIDIEPDKINVKKADFLTYETDLKYDLVITNPPFSLALDCLKKALTLLTPTGKVVFLLRQGFLAAKWRYEEYKANPLLIPHTNYVLSTRPRFIFPANAKKSSDSTDYCWMIWSNDNKRPGEIVSYIMDTEGNLIGV